MAEVGTLSDAAEKRKERLQALKNRAARVDGSEPPGKILAHGEALPKPVFRSYKPSDENLREGVLPKAQPIDVADIVKDQLEASKPEPVVEEIDLTTLAPRKPDWDLKRDVCKKLDKLERRTQRAIAELIRERLEAGKEDLVTAVNAAGHLQEDED